MLPYQLHQKLKIAQTQQGITSSSSPELDKLRGLPFWHWDQQRHTEEHIRTNGQCCFNHVVGLPTKDKKEYPLFDYERLLYDSLLSAEMIYAVKPSTSFKDKHLFVKKATGIGATEFMLRLMGWLCTSTDDYKNSQMCIITGQFQVINQSQVYLMRRI